MGTVGKKKLAVVGIVCILTTVFFFFFDGMLVWFLPQQVDRMRHDNANIVGLRLKHNFLSELDDQSDREWVTKSNSKQIFGADIYYLLRYPITFSLNCKKNKKTVKRSTREIAKLSKIKKEEIKARPNREFARTSCDGTKGLECLVAELNGDSIVLQVFRNTLVRDIIGRCWQGAVSDVTVGISHVKYIGLTRGFTSELLSFLKPISSLDSVSHYHMALVGYFYLYLGAGLRLKLGFNPQSPIHNCDQLQLTPLTKSFCHLSLVRDIVGYSWHGAIF
uniref:Uncharacterized protein n=1 Tax=Strigamia maritima TaxID=126957 RepID=T1J3N6_STRMM